MKNSFQLDAASLSSAASLMRDSYSFRTRGTDAELSPKIEANRLAALKRLAASSLKKEEFNPYLLTAKITPIISSLASLTNNAEHSTAPPIDTNYEYNALTEILGSFKKIRYTVRSYLISLLIARRLMYRRPSRPRRQNYKLHRRTTVKWNSVQVDCSIL